MKKNIGPIDRGVRVIVGLALIGAGIFKGMWWAVVVGAIVSATGVIGWCGLYALLGMNTCPASKPDDKK